MINWDGLLLLNKPQDRTSHSVVQEIRERLNIPKAGHLGTLDPIATGVSPVCLGKATRLASFYMGAEKCYLAAFRFGYFTTTDDREGEPEGPYSKLKFSKEQLEKAISGFQGDYVQTPPSFSAKKIKGQKAYQIARKGKKPELAEQKVKIFDIRLIHFENDVATLFIHCGSGTYVRAIARDLGKKLGCGAHVQELSRTRFGPFSLEQTVAPNAQGKEIRACFIPMEKMLSQFPEVALDATSSKKVLNGSVIELDETYAEEWVRLFSKQQKALIAVAQVLTQDGKQRIQPKVVFS
jgi:tRNA pseudouridine55 synthase